MQSFFVRLIVFICLVFFAHCAMTNPQKTISLNLIVNYPIATQKDKNTITLNNLTDTVKIYYQGDYVVYGLLGPRDFESGKKTGETGEFFIYKKGQDTGRLYPSINAATGINERVDSVLFRKGLTGTKFTYPTLPWSKTDSIWDEGNLREIFAYSAPITSFSTPDSIMYYYSNKLSEYPYSFSSQIDSLKKMKLVRVRMLFNEKIDSSAGLKVPQRELFFWIQKREIIPSDSSVLKLLEHHIKKK